MAADENNVEAGSEVFSRPPFTEKLETLKKHKTKSRVRDRYMAPLTSFEFCFLHVTFNSVYSTPPICSLGLRGMTCSSVCLVSMTFHDSVCDDTVCKAMANGIESRRYTRSCTAAAQQHSEILDSVLTQLRNRFKDQEKMMFLALLNPTKFASYRENILTSELQSLAENC